MMRHTGAPCRRRTVGGVPPLIAAAIIASTLMGSPAVAAGGLSVPVGFYPGDGTGPVQRQELGALESWLGRKATTVVLMTDARSPAHFDGGVATVWVGSSGWSGDNKHSLVVSVPLAFGSDNPSPKQASNGLKATASGAYDVSFRTLAKDLVSSGHGDATLRLGWEYDGTWMPWSAGSDPEGFIAAYRHVHDVFRGVSTNFRFDLAGTAGYEHPSSVPGWHGTVDWASTYPGNDVVDSVGMDVYDQGLRLPYDLGAGTWADPNQAWQVTEGFLRAQLAFAQAHGKQVAYPEWGLSGSTTPPSLDHGGDDPTFINGMAGWFRSLPASGPGSLAFMAYFNANPPTGGTHALSSFPRSESAFRAAFGAGPVASSPAQRRPLPTTSQPLWLILLAVALVAFVVVSTYRHKRANSRKTRAP